MAEARAPSSDIRRQRNELNATADTRHVQPDGSGQRPSAGGPKMADVVSRSEAKNGQGLALLQQPATCLSGPARGVAGAND